MTELLILNQSKSRHGHWTGDPHSTSGGGVEAGVHDALW